MKVVVAYIRSVVNNLKGIHLALLVLASVYNFNQISVIRVSTTPPTNSALGLVVLQPPAAVTIIVAAPKSSYLKEASC